MAILRRPTFRRAIRRPGLKSETIQNPIQVIVSRRKLPQSDVFDHPRQVRVVGGSRFLSAWDFEDHNYDQNPRLVEVIPRSGSPVTYTDAEFVAVMKGTVTSSDYTSSVGYLEGPSVCGFWGLFEDDYGDSGTPQPYAHVTPLVNGRNETLTFACPYCCSGINPKALGDYHDTRSGHGHHWCPHCQMRYYLDTPRRQTVMGAFLSNLCEHHLLGVDVLGAVQKAMPGAGKVTSGTGVVKKMRPPVGGPRMKKDSEAMTSLQIPPGAPEAAVKALQAGKSATTAGNRLFAKVKQAKGPVARRARKVAEKALASGGKADQASKNLGGLILRVTKSTVLGNGMREMSPAIRQMLEDLNEAVSYAWDAARNAKQDAGEADKLFEEYLAYVAEVRVAEKEGDAAVKAGNRAVASGEAANGRGAKTEGAAAVSAGEAAQKAGATAQKAAEIETEEPSPTTLTKAARSAASLAITAANTADAAKREPPGPDYTPPGPPGPDYTPPGPPGPDYTPSGPPGPDYTPPGPDYTLPGPEAPYVDWGGPPPERAARGGGELEMEARAHPLPDIEDYELFEIDESAVSYDDFDEAIEDYEARTEQDEESLQRRP